MSEGSWRFHYRFVGYGTAFEHRRGWNRPAPGTEADVREEGAEPEEVGDHVLGDNEIVTDVGSVCWSDDVLESERILDHHFPGGGPSAAAAAFENAARIATWGETLRERGVQDIYLVSHSTPDFDALGSLYLVRKILEGAIDLENPPEKVNWKRPAMERLDANWKWPALIASYACHVDNAWRMNCPPQFRAHSVLYAARANRDIETEGAYGFFEELRAAIAADRNPLLVSPWDMDTTAYRPELVMLEGDYDLYKGDVRDAWIGTVELPHPDQPYETWFERVRNLPFLEGSGAADPRHLRAGSGNPERVPAIMIRDPQSDKFKEWAREDYVHSPDGKRFVFTAVAFSNRMGKEGERKNRTRYIFSVDPDPERCGNRHLYQLWAALQQAEFEAAGIGTTPEDRERVDRECRNDFKHRAVGPVPWYDGNTFRATIIDTLEGGTHLGKSGGRDLQGTTEGTVEGILHRVLKPQKGDEEEEEPQSQPKGIRDELRNRRKIVYILSAPLLAGIAAILYGLGVIGHPASPAWSMTESEVALPDDHPPPLTLFKPEVESVNSRRILAIGVGIYEDRDHFDSLNNPPADATAVGKKFEEAGYQGWYLQNPDGKELQGAVDTWSASIPKGGLAVFYFAGHGVKIGGQSWLLARNFDLSALQRKGQILNALPADYLVKTISKRRPKNVVLFLDCCRTDPDKEIGEIRQFTGMTRKEGSTNYHIVYASELDQTAKDSYGGGSAHSPFASALLEALEPDETGPGRTLHEISVHVGKRVRELTKDRQKPKADYSPEIADTLVIRANPVGD